MSKITQIRCQEEVSSSKRTYQPMHGEPYTHPDEQDSHQCTFSAQYLIKSIDLYVCRQHAVGVDKKQLLKIK